MASKLAFLRAASAYVAASVLTIAVKGVPAKAEVRELKIVIEGSLRGAAAGGFNFDYRDYQSIAGSAGNAGGVFKGIRLTYNNKQDAVNVSPAEARVLAVNCRGRDPFAEHFRNQGTTGSGLGAAVALNGNAGAVTAFKLPIPICWYNGNLEYPNAVCPSSAQLNRDGTEINLDTDGAHVMTVGDGILPFVNGNAQVVVTAIKVYASTSRVPADFYAPTTYMRRRRITQQPDTEIGPFWEQFLAIESDPSNYEVNHINSITVEVDEIAHTKNTLPTELAQLYGSQCIQDGVLFLDITKNLMCGPFTPSSGAAGTTGLTVTPVMWQDGQSRDDESEWNLVGQYRTITLTGADGDPTTNFLIMRTVPIDESKEDIRAMLSDRGLASTPFEKLAIKGGPAAAMYKPRWLATA